MSTGSQQPASGWTEPPWSGWIETTGDALLILEAARRGVIPRVTRRLVDSERKMITSGSVFVFDEDESGIKRWTDGLFWSPSRILGNFLLYRETDKRGAGHRRAEPQPTEPEPVADAPDADPQSLSRPKGDSTRMGVDRQRERVLVGSLTNSYKFKPNGLMKKTFSLTIGGVSQHLISYYKVEDVESGRLRTPSSIPELSSLEISPEYLDKTHFRNPPKVEIGVDGIPRYCGESDDGADTSPRLVPASLSNTRLPILTEVPISTDSGEATSPNASKRAKRYDPYNSPGSTTTKRSRKKNSIGGGPSSPEDSTHSPSSESPVSPYPELSPQPQYASYPSYYPAYTISSSEQGPPSTTGSGTYAYPLSAPPPASSVSPTSPASASSSYPGSSHASGSHGSYHGYGEGPPAPGGAYPYFPQYPGYTWQHQYAGFPPTQPATLPVQALPRASDDVSDSRGVEAT